MKDRAKFIGRLAGDILHTGGPSEATEKTEEVIKNTFDIVETLCLILSLRERISC